MNSRIFAVWKPRGPSSNAVLNIIRKKEGTKHVGHAGTLDPLAEGILVVGVGREATKKLATEVAKEKEYEAEIILGMVSETDDSEGPIYPYREAPSSKFSAFAPSFANRYGGQGEASADRQDPNKHQTSEAPSSKFSAFAPSFANRYGGQGEASADRQDPNKFQSESQIPNEQEIRNVLKGFVGEIEQMPPAYSALKIQGTPAYKLARRGKTPKLEARKVSIRSIQLLEYKWPILRIRVVTGPGVYIRSLARDIGQALNIGAYMSGLIRTRVGEFTRSEAMPV